jgi:hypothetical protein
VAEGNCYELAGRFVLDRPGEGWVLCHGRPTLQRKPYCEYGHAWAELGVEQGQAFGPVVFDPSTETTMPRAMYYAIGRINPDDVNRYDYEQARRWLTISLVWGPWEGVDADPSEWPESIDDLA